MTADSAGKEPGPIKNHSKTYTRAQHPAKISTDSVFPGISSSKRFRKLINTIFFADPIWQFRGLMHICESEWKQQGMLFTCSWPFFKVFLLFSKSSEQITLPLIKNWVWLRERRNCNQKNLYILGTSALQKLSRPLLCSLLLLFGETEVRRQRLEFGCCFDGAGGGWGGGNAAAALCPFYLNQPRFQGEVRCNTITRLCKHGQTSSFTLACPEAPQVCQLASSLPDLSLGWGGGGVKDGATRFSPGETTCTTDPKNTEGTSRPPHSRQRFGDRLRDRAKSRVPNGQPL